ncbi:MAG: hypothetical protein N3B10_13160 [Armatimonadetes bacterium]|nr:hypothetical protein [Armatimonadota bacterium]
MLKEDERDLKTDTLSEFVDALYPCHWLQPVVDDELMSAEFIRRR